MFISSQSHSSHSPFAPVRSGSAPNEKGQEDEATENWVCIPLRKS